MITLGAMIVYDIVFIQANVFQSSLIKGSPIKKFAFPKKKTSNLSDLYRRKRKAHRPDKPFFMAETEEESDKLFLW